jgi:hypothetical protein
VDLTPGDHRVVEHTGHRRSQRLRPVDDDEDRAADIQAALAQPDEQVGDHGGVLGVALDQRERVLGAVDIDAQRDYEHVLAEVHPVAHQRDQVQLVQRGGEQPASRG